MKTSLRPAWLLAGLTALVLLAFSGRYGYHRDELYFLAAGHHLAWGYPDQPPLTPLLARAMSAIAPDSLVVLRLPSTLSGAAIVLLAGVMARDLGARRSGVWFACACTALSGFVLATGHLLSTATTGILGSTVATYLLLRLLHGGPRWLWPVLGVATGVTLQANVFPAFLLLAVLAAVALVGPRELLRSADPWLAALLTGVIISPYLIWQARHGWPQLDVAHNIAAGGSGSSVPRPLFLPFVLLQNGPWLMPVWVMGLVRLARDARLRCLGVAFGLEVVVFLVLGGKPYYVAGCFPLLFAAGAQPLLDAVIDGVRRRWVPVVMLALSSPALVIALPVLPVGAAGIALAADPDAGETIGWPSFTQQVATAYAALPPGTPILTDNYGQAGAVDRYGGALGLPSAYSGHNGFGLWGRPPGHRAVLAVGIDPALLRRSCTGVRQVGRITTPDGIDNDEDGTVLDTCTPVRAWAELWPAFTHVD